MIKKKKKILIIGGGSMIAKYLIKFYFNDNDKILVTIKNKKPKYLNDYKVEVAILDLESNDSINNFNEKYINNKTKIDVIINLAGYLPGKSINHYSDELIQKVFKINLIGQVILLKKLIPNLSKNAHIILVSSISAINGSYDPIYAASKSAQVGLIKSLSKYLSPNIRINSIAPGLIKNSKMYKDMESERKIFHLKNNPLKKLITLEEIAKIIYDISQPEWYHLNGQTININSGIN